MKHKIKKTWKFIHSGDCYLYEIECTCGEILGDWSPKDVEDKFRLHEESVLSQQSVQNHTHRLTKDVACGDSSRLSKQGSEKSLHPEADALNSQQSLGDKK